MCWAAQSNAALTLALQPGLGGGTDMGRGGSGRGLPQTLLPIPGILFHRPLQHLVPASLTDAVPHPVLAWFQHS